MNFMTIHYFLTLAEEKNFTRAAERLHVTQQTLSGHIAAVEREVGMKLFIRHVPLELTDGGEVFYRYARIFQRNELAFRRALSDVSGSESGLLRIGVAPARGEVLLPPLLEAFHHRYPRVRIVLCEMANARIWKALEREEIDLRWRGGKRSCPASRSTLIRRRRSCCCFLPTCISACRERRRRNRAFSLRRKRSCLFFWSSVIFF